MGRFGKILTLGLLVGVPLIIKKIQKEKTQLEPEKQSKKNYSHKQGSQENKRVQIEPEIKECKRKKEEHEKRKMQLETERKRKEEERKLIQGKKVIRIRGMVDIYKNGKRCQSISVNKEMIIDESQRVAFTGDLQGWVNANYPGGISRSLSVTTIKQCTIEDYYRLKNTF